MSTSFLGLSTVSPFGFGESLPGIANPDNGSGFPDQQAIPPATSSANDFDFLQGSWKIHNRKLKTRLRNANDWIEFEARGEMRKILSGIGNIDNFIATIEGEPFEGMTLRLFNPKTKRWSIYWAASNSGVLEVPVVGSFENRTGSFFAADRYQGRNIRVQFKWDATDPDKPVWSQAFSHDNGKTWEWNWYMTFTRDRENNGVHDQDETINVLELRNYLLKPGMRERFNSYFATHFVTSQNDLGGYVLGQFKISGEENRFFWMRGFSDMKARSEFLPAFYGGSPAWKTFGPEANEMMLEVHNVHLLRPLAATGTLPGESIAPKRSTFLTSSRIVVIDYYTARDNRLEELIPVFQSAYLPALGAAGLTPSLWVSEMAGNDFPRLPVIQDKNLLVVINGYRDEAAYRAASVLDLSVSQAAKSKMQNALGNRHSLVLHKG